LVEKDLEHHRVRLELKLDPQPVPSEVNAGQIQQVMLNLLVNARQAMTSGGALTVVVRGDAKAGRAEISVRDTGPGIPPDVLAKLFQPFFTTKQADEKGQGGNGLGLSLCREVVESHTGRITVQSRLGEGTMFTVTLPLAAAAVELSPAAAVLQRRGRSVARAG
ncbi:MAG: ATP-binding protein, partial [Planctomycetota bacterium]|nr:ATP-binding protein [Planctomycetota bacterium]